MQLQNSIFVVEIRVAKFRSVLIVFLVLSKLLLKKVEKDNFEFAVASFKMKEKGKNVKSVCYSKSLLLMLRQFKRPPVKSNRGQYSLSKLCAHTINIVQHVRQVKLKVQAYNHQSHIYTTACTYNIVFNVVFTLEVQMYQPQSNILFFGLMLRIK